MLAWVVLRFTISGAPTPPVVPCWDDTQGSGRVPGREQGADEWWHRVRQWTGEALSHKTLRGRRVMTRQDVERGLIPVPTHDSRLMTTLEAAEALGWFTEDQAERFIAEHDADLSEAKASLGDNWLDAYDLCVWLGY